MIKLDNENILKLIFNSFMFKYRQLLDQINSKTFHKAILRILTYTSIYKSMGNTKVKIESHFKNIFHLTKLDDRNIISAGWDQTIKVWDVNSLTLKIVLEDEACVKNVTVLQNGNLVSCSTKAIKFWNDFKCFKTLTFEKYRNFNKLIELVNGNLACTACGDIYQYILVLDSTNNYKLINAIIESEGWIYSLINLSECKFASSTESSIISIWDVSVNRPVTCLRGHTSRILCLLYINWDNLLLSGSDDKTIKVWTLEKYKCVRTIHGCNSAVTCFVLLPDGYFACGSDDKSIRLWNLEDFQMINVIPCENDTPFFLLLLKDYKLVSATSKGNIVFWSY
jgi:WD40 repeat protein